MNPTYSSPPPSTSAVTALAPGCGRDVTASPHDRHRCRSQPTPPGRPQQRPPPDRGQCHGLGDPHRSSCDVQFHALRTRHAGRRAFISIHVLVPGGWTVLEGHDLAEDVEAALHEICRTRPCSGQPEPAEAPRSFADTALERRPERDRARPDARGRRVKRRPAAFNHDTSSCLAHTRLAFRTTTEAQLIVLVFDDEGSSDDSVLIGHKAGARASRLPRQLSALAPTREPFSPSPPWPARDMSGGLF